MSPGFVRALPIGHRRIPKRSLGISAIFAMGLLLTTLFSLLYLNQASAVASAGYDIKGLEDQKTQLQIRNEQLRLKLGQLQSLERIEKESANRLNMGPPEKLLFVSIEASPEDGSDAHAASRDSIRQETQHKNASNWWEEFWRPSD